jgi:hypothetical protein
MHGCASAPIPARFQCNIVVSTSNWAWIFWSRFMSITTILIIILVLLFLGALPTWPHSRNWGYRPGGALGIVLLMLIALLLTGRVG